MLCDFKSAPFDTLTTKLTCSVCSYSVVVATGVRCTKECGQRSLPIFETVDAGPSGQEFYKLCPHRSKTKVRDGKARTCGKRLLPVEVFSCDKFGCDCTPQKLGVKSLGADGNELANSPVRTCITCPVLNT